MAKTKNTAFFCRECGYESAKWSGQCPACKEWNTFVEEPVATEKKTKGIVNVGISAGRKTDVKPSTFSQISTQDKDRMSTGIAELDRVLGGGVVEGSLVLVGGDPGIGKSTLLLQMCNNMASDNRKVLYISGEESLKQIKIRAGKTWKQ